MLDLSPLRSAIGVLIRTLSVTGDVRRWQQFDAETQEALKAGVIDDVDRWMDFHAARNQTSHTYNRAIAQTVFDLAPVFAVQAQALLAQLEQRND